MRESRRASRSSGLRSRDRSQPTDGTRDSPAGRSARSRIHLRRSIQRCTRREVASEYLGCVSQVPRREQQPRARLVPQHVERGALLVRPTFHRFVHQCCYSLESRARIFDFERGWSFLPASHGSSSRVLGLLHHPLTTSVNGAASLSLSASDGGRELSSTSSA